MIIDKSLNQDLLITTSITNFFETAYEVQLLVQYEPSLSFVEVIDMKDTKNQNCFDKVNFLSSSNGFEQLNIGIKNQFFHQLFPPNETCNLMLKFIKSPTLHLTGNISSSLVLLKVLSKKTLTFNEINDLNNDKNFTTNFIYRSNTEILRLSSSSTVEFENGNDVTNITSLPKISFSFQVRKTGYSNIPKSILNFSYPFQISENQPLITLTNLICESSKNGSTCKCEYPKKYQSEYFNITSITQAERKPITRDNFDCEGDDVTFQCENIQCSVDNLVSLTFTAEFYIWTPSLYFVNRTNTTITSRLKFSSEDSPLIQDPSGSVIRREAITKVLLKEFFEIKIDDSIGIWVYIVSVVVPSFVILILSFILYKKGFFKSKYDEMVKDFKDEMDDFNFSEIQRHQ